MNRFSSILLVALASLAGGASAALVYGPTSASSTLSTFDGSLAATYNQSGLSAGYTSGVTNFETYVTSTTHASPNPGNAWAVRVSDLPGFITYDLGDAILIEKLAVWTSFGGFSVGDFTVFTSLDDVTFTDVGSFSAIDTVAPMPGQVFDLADTTGRYVRLSIQTSRGAGAANVSEVVIGGSEALTVPEPASLALVSAALLVAGAARRRSAVVR